MGYTTYFPQHRAFTDLEWSNLLEWANLIIKETKVPLLGYEEEPNSKPILNENQIRFNGVGSDGYETFLITKKHNKKFNFCKTAEKPYDEVVCAILIACSRVAPGVLQISSDGRWNEWQAGVELFKKALGVDQWQERVKLVAKFVAESISSENFPNDNSRVQI